MVNENYVLTVASWRPSDHIERTEPEQPAPPPVFSVSTPAAVTPGAASQSDQSSESFALLTQLNRHASAVPSRHLNLPVALLSSLPSQAWPGASGNTAANLAWAEPAQDSDVLNSKLVSASRNRISSSLRRCQLPFRLKWFLSPRNLHYISGCRSKHWTVALQLPPLPLWNLSVPAESTGQYRQNHISN